MRKADKRKLLSIIGISLIVFLSGCVDTSVQPISSSYNFRSQVKIVNLAPNAGAATISMAIASGGSMSFGPVNAGEETPGSGQAFTDMPAGAKTLNVTYSGGGSDVFKLVTETDYKMRIFIVSDTANVRTAVKSTERYIWQEKGTANGAELFPSDTAQLAFVNGCPDVSVSQLIFHNTSTQAEDTVTVSRGAFEQGNAYQKVKAGNYSVFVVAGSDTLTTMSFNGQSQGRYTAVIYDRLSSLKNKIFTDD